MKLNMRRAVSADLMTYFDWANDSLVRQQSFYSDQINLEDHSGWFARKLKDPNTLMFVFEIQGLPSGQVRIEMEKEFAVIGISIDQNFRGKGLGNEMLSLAVIEYFRKFDQPIVAYIKTENRASGRIFEKAGFVHKGQGEVNSIKCEKYIRSK